MTACPAEHEPIPPGPASPSPSRSLDGDLTLQIDGSACSLNREDEDEEQPLVPGSQIGGFKRKGENVSLPESHSTVHFCDKEPWYKQLYSFAGVGFLISVGYSDPGNWATDIAAGSKFGYTLLFVVLVSSLAAMFLQYLALKLGIATERDLAQACRDTYRPWVNKSLWVLAELGIAAMDLAEVLGSATALNLLSNGAIPLWAGVLMTAVDVFIMMILELKNFRALEVFVVVLTFVIMGCFIYELAASKPDMGDVMAGFLPKGKMVTDPTMLYYATGILGATVMPHNLYLHSSVVQTRAYSRTSEGKNSALLVGFIDTIYSLLFALFINAAILILAASAFFYADPPIEVTDITEAFKLLSPSLGAKAASILFGVALLASSQNATITGTLAGQIVMEGFIDMKLKPWQRRVLTRGMAIIPAGIVAAILGSQGVTSLLVLSQVILSLTLPFTVFPLVHFTSSAAHMGKAYNNHWFMRVVSITVFVLITALNVNLVISSIVYGEFGGS